MEIFENLSDIYRETISLLYEKRYFSYLWFIRTVRCSFFEKLRQNSGKADDWVKADIHTFGKDGATNF